MLKTYEHRATSAQRARQPAAALSNAPRIQRALSPTAAQGAVDFDWAKLPLLPSNRPSSSTPCACKNAAPTMAAPVRAKLVVGAARDAYEQEADRIADLVVQSSPSARVAAPTPALPSTLRRMCARCAEEEGEPLRRSPLQAQSAAGAGGLVVSNAMQSGIETLQRRGGGALPEPTRGFMEQRLGHDFSKVRIHADAHAGELAQGLGARAFAVGSDLVFAPGEYRPHTQDGMRLLAHELVHTLQAAPGRIHRQQCAYGEIRSWAIVSQRDLSAPAGLADAVASLEASCARGQPCSCVDGSTATAPGDQAAWQNINAASGGTDQSGGGEYMCVGTQQCQIVQRCYQCNGNQRELVDRATPLEPVGQTTVTGKGTLYFYSDPLQGWCNATDRRTACRSSR